MWYNIKCKGNFYYSNKFKKGDNNMELDRKTIENDMEYLRQISAPVDFENDNYLEYIKKIKRILCYTLLLCYGSSSNRYS